MKKEKVRIKIFEVENGYVVRVADKGYNDLDGFYGGFEYVATSVEDLAILITKLAQGPQ